MIRKCKLGLFSICFMFLSACGTVTKTSTTTTAPVSEPESVGTPTVQTPDVVDADQSESPDIEPLENTPQTIEKPNPVVVAAPVKRSPAVNSLLASADKQQGSGDYRSAQNTLQRAQRIAPRDPQVYYALAETHMELETYALAEQVALKGVSLVQGQNKELKRFWNLIAQIRLRAGNPVGAEQAQTNASKY